MEDKCRWENLSSPDYPAYREWRIGCKNIISNKGYDYLSDLNAVYIYCPYCGKKIEEWQDDR